MCALSALTCADLVTLLAYKGPRVPELEAGGQDLHRSVPGHCPRAHNRTRPLPLPIRPAHGPIYNRKDSTSQSSASSIATVASVAPLPPARRQGGGAGLWACSRQSPPPHSADQLLAHNHAMWGCQPCSATPPATPADQPRVLGRGRNLSFLLVNQELAHRDKAGMQETGKG